MTEPEKKPHPCEDPDEPGTFNHDWRFVSDWEGDPEVPGGTNSFTYGECRRCGEVDPGMEPPSSDDWD